MNSNTFPRHILLLPLLGIVLLAPPSVSAPYSEQYGEEGKEEMQRWKPTYRPMKKRELSQRERRTGVISHEFEEEATPAVKEEPMPEKKDKTGFWPFKKDKDEEEGDKRGFWPFGKKDKEEEAAPMEGASKEGSADKMKGKAEAAAEEADEDREPAEKRGLMRRFVGKSKKDTEEMEEQPKKAETSVVKRIEKPLDPVALPKDTPESYLRGKQAFDKGEYAKAIRYFGDFIASDVLENNPLIPPARYFIAKSFEELEQTDVAISLYKQIQDQHQTNKFWSGLAGFELAALYGTSGAAVGEVEGDWKTTSDEEEPMTPTKTTETTKPARGEGISEAVKMGLDEEVAPPEMPVEPGEGEEVPPSEVPVEGGPAAPAGAPEEAPNDAPSFAPGAAPGR